MDASKSKKDLLSGLIFIGLGLSLGYSSSTYGIGTPFRMGPGLWPLVLSGVLVLLGATVFIGAFRTEGTPIAPTPWRAAVLLVGSLFFFGATVRGLGLIPAVATVVFLSSFASRRTGLLAALALTVGLTAFCVLVFIEGLGLPLRLFGPWLNLRG